MALRNIDGALALDATVSDVRSHAAGMLANQTNGNQRAGVFVPGEPLAAPAAPTVVESTVAVETPFAVGSYNYGITAMEGSSRETTISPGTTVQQSSGETTNLHTISWAAVPGASHYKVYRRYFDPATGFATEFEYVTQTYDATTLSVDVSTLQPQEPGVFPPTVNTTVGTPIPIATEATLEALRVLLAKQDRGTSPVRTVVTVATTPTLVIAANANRKKVLIYNSGSVACFIAIGGPGSLDDYSFQLGAGGTYEEGDITSAVHAVTSLGTGTLRVTEVT